MGWQRGNKTKIITVAISFFALFGELFSVPVNAFNQEISANFFPINNEKIQIDLKNNENISIFNLSFKIDCSDDEKIIEEIGSHETISTIFSLSSCVRNFIILRGSYYKSQINDKTNSKIVFTKPFVFNREINEIQIMSSKINVNIFGGSFNFQIQNKSDQEKELKLQYFSDESVKIHNEQEIIHLKAKESKTISKTISNRFLLEHQPFTIFLLINNNELYEFESKIVENNASKKSLAITTVMLLILIFIKKKIKLNHTIFELIFILIISASFFLIFPLKLILSNTTTTGGDTFSHYNIGKYASENIFPEWKLSDWYQGSFLGFSLFTFYMPLPFLLIFFLKFLTGYNIAFKIITIIGAVLFPFAVFIFSRNRSFPYYFRFIMPIFALIFLYNESYTIYGGNLFSLLAGEFAQSLSMIFYFLFKASLLSDINKKKGFIRTSFLLALTGLFHVYPFILALVEQIFFILPIFKRKEIKSNLKILFKSCFFAFFLCAWFYIPIILFRSETTPLNDFWIFKFNEIFPIELSVFLIFGFLTSVLGLIRLDKITIYFLFSFLIALFFSFISNKWGLVNVRFAPFMLLHTLFLSGYGFSKMFQIVNKLIKHKQFKFKKIIVFEIQFLKLFLPFFALFIGLSSVSDSINWFYWNYSGIESKSYFTEYSKLINFLRNLPSNERVAYEHNNLLDNVGTNRVFESLFVVAGKPTLEGLYIQSTASAPFVYSFQSEISEFPTYVIPNIDYKHYNAMLAQQHLNLFNVRYIIIVSNKSKKFFDEKLKLNKIVEIFPFVIYENQRLKPGFVQVLHKKEIRLLSKNQWKNEGYRKFLDEPELTFIENQFEIDKIDDNCNSEMIENTTFLKNGIKFFTNQINCPHLIKISYFPKFRAIGAEKIYRTGTNYMIVVPKNKEIEIIYQ